MTEDVCISKKIDVPKSKVFTGELRASTSQVPIEHVVGFCIDAINPYRQCHAEHEQYNEVMLRIEGVPVCVMEPLPDIKPFEVMLLTMWIVSHSMCPNFDHLGWIQPNQLTRHFRNVMPQFGERWVEKHTVLAELEQE